MAYKGRHRSSYFILTMHNSPDRHQLKYYIKGFDSITKFAAAMGWGRDIVQYVTTEDANVLREIHRAWWVPGAQKHLVTSYRKGDTSRDLLCARAWFDDVITLEEGDLYD